MEVIPAIDLLGRQAVRLEQGDYESVTDYGKPTDLAARFAAEGARRIHVVDLDGARAGMIRPVVVAALVEASAPALVQASGGVRSPADALTLVRSGAERVVVGTAAWTALDEFVDALADRLVIALDVRDGFLWTRGWTERSLALDEAIARCVTAGAPRLLCTAIDRDGTLDGPDVELVQRVVEQSGLPVLAAGGVRSDVDLDALEHTGAEAAIVGRALLEGRIKTALRGTSRGQSPGLSQGQSPGNAAE